jgi:putative membrane protein
MKQVLSGADRSLLDRRIAETEKQTRAQIVLASVLRSDSYAEIPWKAFAIGASLASLILIFLDLFMFGWVTNSLILSSLAAILATGALFALLSVFLPGFGRLFLSNQRKETECMQYAESLFLSNELFATQDRRGILILVSQFERQVVILPDTGVRDLLNTEVLEVVISVMTSHLRRNELRQAMVSGLEGIHSALGFDMPEWEDRNELSNEIIEEDGV